MPNKRVMIQGKKMAYADLGRVLVLGLGKSGRIAAQYCLELLGGRVDSVTIAAGKRNEKAESFAEECQRRGARVVFNTETIEDTYDVCIASPGISQFSDFYKNAQSASIEIMSEVEFAWRESNENSLWVAVTGTNGKTTTTALCAHMLKTAGMNAVAVGNIGDTCLEAVASGSFDAYVAETSSYQLASTIDFAPNVAVMLNITPDHVKWHKSHEAYVAAKMRLLANLGKQPASVAVMDAMNATVREKVNELLAENDQTRGFAVVPVGGEEGLTCDMRQSTTCKNAAFVDADDDNMLVVALDGFEHRLCTSAELLIPGAHNVSNALAASAAALAAGASEQYVRSALKSFSSLEHRIEECGFVGGVECFNDSKATNVDATLKALSAFDPRRPIVLLGGDDKMTSLDVLVAEAQRHCKAVVCFGASRERFLAAFESASIPVYQADHLEDALDEALRHAVPEDIVLLSPACASFDEFTCFEERGDVFKRLVSQRAAG